MERDRAGILFSNILRQVRGRIYQNESQGSHDMYSGQYGGSRGGMTPNGMNSQSFFRTSTTQINYKQILGFEKTREEEEEAFNQQQQNNQ